MLAKFYFSDDIGDMCQKILEDDSPALMIISMHVHEDWKTTFKRAKKDELQRPVT